MHTVQPTLERGTADRPAGPALGTAVPAEGWHWLALGHWSASRRLALARTGHPVPAPAETLGTAAPTRSGEKRLKVSLCPLFLLKIALKSTLEPFPERLRPF